jgi:hypothetical protein
MTRAKVPVSTRAVIARINRKRKPDDEMVKVTRGDRWRHELGAYYVVNFARNWIVNKDIDPETYARELGVLDDFEEMRDE